ncbi:putative Kinesin-II 95 kDa subunit [Blattamonas nauphoetae]|uniref:Kinesin-like protein n=1 Tax=Blattamonas nauphoetae TaxID=2049346 RepID=A0ABQ9YKN9_9EUKA|nr:putative Kinesin-II 95 kDa subunit [Blattamonas nauphoetae]
MSEGKEDNVQVVVRCRPLSQKEVDAKYKMCVHMNRATGSIRIVRPKDSQSSGEPEHTYTFDHIYPPDATQSSIYDETCRRIINSVMDGFNGTIFAYGQTGTGKTHTMTGYPDDPGVIPRSFQHIFSHIEQADKTKQFLVSVSYLEIYREKIQDLLSKKENAVDLPIKEHPKSGVYVKDLTIVVCKDPKMMEAVMQKGSDNRVVAETKMNKTSSRSHSIFQISVECADLSQLDKDGNPIVRVGRLNMVDLAGSERQSKTEATGDRLMEAIEINKSLLTLGTVINMLTKKNPGHIPYRDSKLTRLLQDSLGGNAKTVMIANLGPAEYNYDETFSTLKYANRAKQIKNKPVINSANDPLVLKMQEEIAELKRMLEMQKRGEIVVQQDDEAIERLKAELKAKAKEEKSALESDKKRLEEERKKIEEDLKKRQAEVDKEKEERSRTEAKLRKMQAKVIKGGSKFQELQELRRKDKQEYEEQLAQQKLQAEEAEKEKERLRKEREEAKRLLDAKVVAEIDLKKQFSSAQDELKTKKKQLESLLNEYKKAKTMVAEAQSEINELQNEFEEQREDMLASMSELEGQMNLFLLIAQLFIPEQEQQRVRRLAVWDEDVEEWRLRMPDELDPDEQDGMDFVSIVPDDRMRQENSLVTATSIIQPQQDMPVRTTETLGKAFEERQRMQHMLGQVLDEEDDLHESEDELLYATQSGHGMGMAGTRGYSGRSQGWDGGGMTQTRPMSGKRQRPDSASRHKEKAIGSSAPQPVAPRSSHRRSKPKSSGDEEFPSSRGLVRAQYE